MKTMSRDARGFTLTEMLVTVGLVGILAAVALPSVASRTRTFDMAREARQLHTDMSRLRSRAVAEGREYEVVVAEGSQVTIQRREVEGAGEGEDQARGIERTARFPEGSSVKLNGSDSGTIVFSPTGRVSASGDIVLQDSRRKLTVRVLASGMTRLIVEPIRTDQR